MYLGIDLGTSSIKVVLIDEQEQLLASVSEPLDVARPKPLCSEQNPADWWRALESLMDTLATQYPAELGQVRAIGLSGQMHGATLLDADGEVLRPCILWNDGRSVQECRELESGSEVVEITGNRAMAGFTAPKLLWVARHEPALFARIAHVLLPKDYLRYRLSGDLASDCSDSAGTLWLATQSRQWSPALLDACGLRVSQMPRVYEGSEVTGTLTRELSARWGMASDVKLVAGGGDNAASAVGLGLTEPGEAFVSLGTSGVIFVVSDRYGANPAQGVHSFCHALPGRWHHMAVTLSAASSLGWLATITGMEEARLAALAEQSEPGSLLFAPYLSGERTPWNDPELTGALFGLTGESQSGQLARAVMEGVAFSLADGLAALANAGSAPRRLLATGGGARSRFWLQLIADVTGVTVDVPAHAEVGAAFGAARLAHLALVPTALARWRNQPAVQCTLTPTDNGPLLARYARYRHLTHWLSRKEI